MLVALGESDCELIHGGLLAQPVNALTSLAFVVVGVAVASRGRKDRTSAAIGFAALLVAVGVGSVAFHGPQLPGAQVLHDTSIHLLLGFVVLHRIGTGRAPVSLRALATLGAASVLLVAAAPGFAAGLTAVLAATAVLVEVRWHALRSQPWWERRITGALAAVLAVAGTCFVLGRTGAPTCDPLGVLQFHGLWHVSAATAFGLWWWQLESSAEGPEPAAEVTEGACGSAVTLQRRAERARSNRPTGERASRGVDAAVPVTPATHCTAESGKAPSTGTASSGPGVRHCPHGRWHDHA